MSIIGMSKNIILETLVERLLTVGSRGSLFKESLLERLLLVLARVSNQVPTRHQHHPHNNCYRRHKIKGRPASQRRRRRGERRHSQKSKLVGYSGGAAVQVQVHGVVQQ
jgi:hypothetical protein